MPRDFIPEGHEKLGGVLHAKFDFIPESGEVPETETPPIGTKLSDPGFPRGTRADFEPDEAGVRRATSDVTTEPTPHASRLTPAEGVLTKPDERNVRPRRGDEGRGVAPPPKDGLPRLDVRPDPPGTEGPPEGERPPGVREGDQGRGEGPPPKEPSKVVRDADDDKPQGMGAAAQQPPPPLQANALTLKPPFPRKTEPARPPTAPTVPEEEEAQFDGPEEEPAPPPPPPPAKKGGRPPKPPEGFEVAGHDEEGNPLYKRLSGKKGGQSETPEELLTLEEARRASITDLDLAKTLPPPGARKGRT